MTERAVQAACVDLYRRVGCRVRSTSQPRRAKYVSPGIPDLMVWHTGQGAFWFHEVKDEHVPTPEQLRFADDCAACGIPCIVGGTAEARRWLEQIGVLAA